MTAVPDSGAEHASHTTGVTEFGRPGGVSSSRTALERCISVPVAEFAEQVWASRPLVSPANDDYADLFGASAVDQLVSEQGLRTPFLRMAKQGVVHPATAFTRSGGKGAGIADQVADDKVLDLLVDGSTLVLQGLHRTWPPLVGFASELSAELGHSVQINAYVTPAGNQGFNPHYDTHDVFVLQIAGTKRWAIYPPVLEAPLESQPWDGDPTRRAMVAAQAENDPLIDTVLAPGDALYLPRGFVHAPVAQDDLSIHLTIGVHVTTRRAVLGELLRALPDELALRSSLPMGVDLADPAILRPHVEAVAGALREWLAGSLDADVARVADGIERTLRADTRPAPIAPLAQAETIAALTPTTALRVRPGLRWKLSADQDGVELRVLDKTLRMPSATETAVKTILSGAEATVPVDWPGLGAEEALVLARRLLREAVLVPA